MTFSRSHFPSKTRLQRTAVARKQRFECKHLAEIQNRPHVRLVCSPTGSIFDQRAHICAELFEITCSLSAILLFEREVNLLLYESSWLYVYTLLSFYSIKKQSRRRFLAKLQTYILHDKMQNALFSASIWNVSRSGRESLWAPQNGSSVSPGPFRAS